MSLDLTQLKALHEAATDAPWEPHIVQNAIGARWPSFQIPKPSERVYSAEHIDSDLLCYLRNNAPEIIRRLEAGNDLVVALEKIKAIPSKLYGDHWCHQEALDIDTVRDACTEALAAYRKEGA